RLRGWSAGRAIDLRSGDVWTRTRAPTGASRTFYCPRTSWPPRPRPCRLESKWEAISPNAACWISGSFLLTGPDYRVRITELLREIVVEASVDHDSGGGCVTARSAFVGTRRLT